MYTFFLFFINVYFLISCKYSVFFRRLEAEIIQFVFDIFFYFFLSNFIWVFSFLNGLSFYIFIFYISLILSHRNMFFFCLWLVCLTRQSSILNCVQMTTIFYGLRILIIRSRHSYINANSSRDL